MLSFSAGGRPMRPEAVQSLHPRLMVRAKADSSAPTVFYHPSIIITSQFLYGSHGCLYAHTLARSRSYFWCRKPSIIGISFPKML
jgi:hypothetical protein